MLQFCGILGRVGGLIQLNSYSLIGAIIIGIKGRNKIESFSNLSV